MTNTEQVNDRKARTRVGTSGIMFDERAAWGVSCSVFVGVEESEGLLDPWWTRDRRGGKAALGNKQKRVRRKNLSSVTNQGQDSALRCLLNLKVQHGTNFQQIYFGPTSPQIEWTHTKSPMFVAGVSSPRESTDERQP